MTETNKLTELPLSEIRINGRFRTELGDVRGLADSIREVGLLHPVVVDGDGNLIAGERRVAAVKLLGWQTIPVTVRKLKKDRILPAERDENAEREQLRPSEAVALAKALEPQEREEAARREKEGGIKGGKTAGRGRPKQGSAETADPYPDQGETRDKVAAAAGMGRTTLKQAQEVVEAAEEDPGTYGDLIEQMDGKANVSKAYKELLRRRNEAALQQAQEAISEERRRSVEAVCDLRVCSCRDLFASDIRPDAVITDPPYSEEFLPCFSELAEACRDVPLVAVMSGQSYLPEVLRRLCEHLSYRWTMAYMTPGGQSPQQWQAKINTSWKPVLLFGIADNDRWIGDVAASKVNDNDKRFHGWGQSESGMADLIERLTKPGQLVCDPFVGGGTTAVASMNLGRRFIGCDLDASCVDQTRRRVETMDVEQ